MMDEELFYEIAAEVTKNWEAFGRAGVTYERYAKEVLRRYLIRQSSNNYITEGTAYNMVYVDAHTVVFSRDE